MSNWPGHDPYHPANDSDAHIPIEALPDVENPIVEDFDAYAPDTLNPEPLIYSHIYDPVPPPAPIHIPNFGHFAFLILFTIIAFAATSIITLCAYSLHLFNVHTREQMTNDIHYVLGTQGIWYLLLLIACIVFFPRIWHKGFFEGLHWNGAQAIEMRGKLIGTAFLCIMLAFIDGLLMPGPKDTPIDKILRTPGAAWFLFVFGTTLAPFFEELFFRGFLLPALCTAYDWFTERKTGRPAPDLDPTGHPQWSITAMILASIITSIPFALMHADQTGHAIGPLVLLFCVSMILCWARLSMRSLAASVLVHFSYNFLLFSIMLIGTQGFKHMDNLQ